MGRKYKDVHDDNGYNWKAIANIAELDQENLDTAMCKEDQKLMDLWNESHKTIFTHSAQMEILNTMHF